MSRDFDEESLEIERRERAEDREDRRTLLLMAASIAAGLESNPVCDDSTPRQIAERAVATARAILEEVDRGE